MKNKLIKVFLITNLLILTITTIDNLGVDFFISSNIHELRSEESKVKSGQLLVKCFVFKCSISMSNLDDEIYKISHYQYKLFNKIIIWGSSNNNTQIILNDNMIFGLHNFRILELRVVDNDTLIILRNDATSMALSATYHGRLSSFSKIYN